MGSSKRIGERLVEAGLVTPGLLERALESQVVHGARLGTNLVEIGKLSLDALAGELAAQHGLPAAVEKHFDRSDPAMQKRLSPELAAQWHVIPLGLVGDPPRVAVAGTDPLPEEAVFELEEVFGMSIVPAIAPELRILYYLERVYGIERLNRFRRTRTPASGVPAIDHDERRRYVRTLSGEEPVEVPGALAKIAVKRIAVPVTGVLEVQGRLDTAHAGARAMRSAQSRNRVGEALVKTLRESFDEALEAAMVLIVREGLAFGWKGFVREKRDELVEAVALPLSEPGVLARPYRNREPFFGAPQEGGSALDHKMWAHIETGPPAEVAVVPVELFGEIACLLYAQSRGEMPAEVAGGIAELAQGMAAAFHRLVRAAER